jgi:hypothetical protein
MGRGRSLGRRAVDECAHTDLQTRRGVAGRASVRRPGEYATTACAPEADAAGQDEADGRKTGMRALTRRPLRMRGAATRPRGSSAFVADRASRSDVRPARRQIPLRPGTMLERSSRQVKSSFSAARSRRRRRAGTGHSGSAVVPGRQSMTKWRTSVAGSVCPRPGGQASEARAVRSGYYAGTSTIRATSRSRRSLARLAPARQQYATWREEAP